MSMKLFCSELTQRRLALMLGEGRWWCHFLGEEMSRLMSSSITISDESIGNEIAVSLGARPFF